MSDRIYAQDEIFAAVRLLLKKYHAESAILFGSYAPHCNWREQI